MPPWLPPFRWLWHYWEKPTLAEPPCKTYSIALCLRLALMRSMPAFIWCSARKLSFRFTKHILPECIKFEIVWIWARIFFNKFIWLLHPFPFIKTCYWMASCWLIGSIVMPGKAVEPIASEPPRSLLAAQNRQRSTKWWYFCMVV